MEKIQLFAPADLATRWEMTRQGVHQRSKNDPDFPQPYTHVQNRRLPLYLLEDIEAYEEKNPELLDPVFRERKIIWNFVNVVINK